MSVMLSTGASFVKKTSYLVARVVSFDTVGLHLFTFHILEPYPHKNILTLILTPMLLSFPAAKT